MSDEYEDAPIHGAGIIKFLTYCTVAAVVGAIAVGAWLMWGAL